MPHSQSQIHSLDETAHNSLAALTEQNQLDFELGFFSGIVRRNQNYVDALRAHGNNLTLKGRYHDGLIIDQRLIELRPNDPIVRYNLACSYALLGRSDASLNSLRQAIEMGYRDFRYIREDRDLDAIRNDPRFDRILSEYENG